MNAGIDRPKTKAQKTKEHQQTSGGGDGTGGAGGCTRSNFRAFERLARLGLDGKLEAEQKLGAELGLGRGEIESLLLLGKNRDHAIRGDLLQLGMVEDARRPVAVNIRNVLEQNAVARADRPRTAGERLGRLPKESGTGNKNDTRGEVSQRVIVAPTKK
jgi:hypothetical protein